MENRYYSFLEKLGEKFLELARSQGLDINNEDIGKIVADDHRSYDAYRKILISSKITSLPRPKNSVHFEWRILKNKNILRVAFHLEYSKDKKYLNRELLQFIKSKAIEELKRIENQSKGG